MIKIAFVCERIPCRQDIKTIVINFQFTLLGAYPLSGIAVQIFCGAFIILQSLRVSSYGNNVFGRQFAMSVYRS